MQPHRNAANILLLFAGLLAGIDTINATDKSIWETGHGDLAVNYVDGGWRWNVEQGMEVDDVIITIRDNARTRIPDSSSFGFLGATGDPIWIIPAGQTPRIPFMGINAQLTSSTTFVNGRFELLLHSKQAPGDFVMWTIGGTGTPNVQMNSREGITGTDKTDVPAGGHFHQNWGFTAPGTYRLGFKGSGTLVGANQPVSSDEAIYTFEIGVLRNGEADIEVAYEEGKLKFHIHDAATDTDFDPAHVALHAGPPSWQTVPENPALAFLGIPGKRLHVFPQDETAGVLFLGLAAGEVPSGVFANDHLDIRLTALTGPGDLFYYEMDAFGVPTIRFNSADGFAAVDTVEINAGSHVHRNWAFTEPGIYRVTLVASGELAVGGTLSSEPTTFLFEVFAPNFIDRGEIDLEIGFVNGSFKLALLNEAIGKDFCADEVVLVGRAPTATAVPDDPAFSFLGSPGATIHVLPQNETEGLLFLGLAADEIEPGQFLDESVQLRLVSIDGPGNVALYGIGQFGVPTIYWNSSDGLSAADAFRAAVGSHSHANWAFTAPGVYRIGLKATGTLVLGNTAIESEIISFRFQIKAPARVSLTAARVEGSALRVGWNTEDGSRYQMRSRTSLTAGSWENVGGTFIGDGNAATREVPITSDPLKVFQVVELP